jgi:hypothetical protein
VDGLADVLKLDVDVVWGGDDVMSRRWSEMRRVERDIGKQVREGDSCSSEAGV